MPLTLNQFLLLVITIAVVVAVTFLVSLMIQFRKTAREGQETLSSLRALVENLNTTNQKVQIKMDEVGDIVEATKKTATSLSEIAWFATTKFVRPKSKFWPFLFPFVRLGWRQLKKKKEDKHGK